MTTYNHEDLILAITMEDVLNQASQYGENLDPKIEACLRDNQRKFEKALEWGIMEHVWDIVANVTDDVLTANGLARTET